MRTRSWMRSLAILLLAPLALSGESRADTEPASEGILMRLAQPLELGTAVIERELVSLAQAAVLMKRLDALAPGSEVYLVLDGLRVETDPGVLVQVELVSTAALRSTTAAPVGSFSVYGVAHARGATAQRSFAVTAAVRRLAGQGGIALRLRPGAGAAPGAKVEIGKVYLVIQ